MIRSNPTPAVVWRRLAVVIVVISVVTALLFAFELRGRGPQRPSPSVDQRAPSVEIPAAAPAYPPNMGELDEQPVAAPLRSLKKMPAGKSTSAWHFAPPATRGMTVGQLHALASSTPVGPEAAEAVVDLAYKLKDCSTFLNQRRATAAVLKAGQSVPEELRLSLEAERQKSEPTCGDTTEQIQAASDRMVEELALQGDMRARYAYATMLHYPRNEQDVISDPERYALFQRKAVEYLEQLAAAGHVYSLSTLASVYANPVFNRVDRAKAWAFSYAAAVASESVQSQQALLDGLLSTYDPSEQIRAREEAARILTACCGVAGAK